MGYARADSRPRLRCRTSRGRPHGTIIILAVYGVTIAFGLSDKSGTLSSNHSRDLRHDPDTEPSDLTVPPAPPPNVRIAVAVPIVDSTCYGPSYWLPGSKEAPLAGHASRFDPRRAIPMARRSAFANSFRDVDGKARRRTRLWPETSLRDRPTRPHHQRCNPEFGRNGRPG